MPRRFARGRAIAASAVASAALASCGMFGGGDKPAPVIGLAGASAETETVSLGNGYGLNLPKTVAGFVRTDTHDADRHGGGEADVVAGYARTTDPAPLIATIRVHHLGSGGSLIPLIGDDSPNATKTHSAAALEASIAQVRHFYPGAQLVEKGTVYLVRFGVVQQGARAVLRYEDEMDGTRQPIRLVIDTFCCLDGKWDYEYRFRSPDGLDTAEAPTSFLGGIAWSSDPSASIEAPN